MKKNILFLILFSIVLSNCGFTPLYTKNFNFSLSDIKLQGDKNINNSLKMNLQPLKKNESNKKFKLNINTKYNKNVLSKDRAAKITDYEISSTSIVQITLNNKFIKEITIKENINMVNMSDKFEEESKELVIKQNFASSIYNKLITELSLINDN
tara:strand:+ start:971 stop:1432 length:462 start_codon:yes stop_codon:yes gene_type:complete